MRVPIWSTQGDATAIIGDARFGDGTGSAFADVRIDRRKETCRSDAPWTPPRRDLLSEGGAEADAGR